MMYITNEYSFRIKIKRWWKPSKKAFIFITVVVLLLATLIKHNVGDRIVEIAGMKELVYFKEELRVAASVNYFVDRGLILRNLCT